MSGGILRSELCEYTEGFLELVCSCRHSYLQIKQHQRDLSLGNRFNQGICHEQTCLCLLINGVESHYKHICCETATCPCVMCKGGRFPSKNSCGILPILWIHYHLRACRDKREFYSCSKWTWNYLLAMFGQFIWSFISVICLQLSSTWNAQCNVQWMCK